MQSTPGKAVAAAESVGFTLVMKGMVTMLDLRCVVTECEELAAKYSIGYVEQTLDPHKGAAYRQLRSLLGDDDTSDHGHELMPQDEEHRRSPSLVPRLCLRNADAAHDAQRHGLAQVSRDARPET
jgi:hypothetical protein